MANFILGKDFKELIAHSKNYLTAEFLLLVLSFLSLPVFTRILSSEEFGIMSVFISFTTLFSVLFGFGLRGAVMRYYYEENKDFYTYLSSILWFSCLSSFVIIILIFLFKNTLASLFNIPIHLLYLGVLISAFSVIIQICQSYLQASKKSKILSIQKIIYNTVSLGLAVFLMFYLPEDKFYGRAIGLLVATLLILIVCIKQIKNKIVFKIKKTHIIYSLSFGIPIMFHLLSQNVLSTFDQIMINKILGAKETGLYSVAYRVGLIQNIITMAILAAWTPIFYSKMNEKKYSDITKLTVKFSLIVTLVATFLILFSKELILVFATKEYLESSDIISLVVISYFFFFLYSIYSAYSFYRKKTKLIAVFTLVAGLVNVILNNFVIPYFGYIGAAWSTLISYFILFLLHYIYVNINKLEVVKFIFFISNLFFLMIYGILVYFLNDFEIAYYQKFLIKISLLFFVTFFLYFKFLKNN